MAGLAAAKSDQAGGQGQANGQANHGQEVSAERSAQGNANGQAGDTGGGETTTQQGRQQQQQPQPQRAPQGGGQGRQQEGDVHETRGGEPNSGCSSHMDPRDPGSCQEKGGGNAGDIDAFRGPDRTSNDPATGNDCDEGGGNNRTSYPRSTNPNNSGDSDVDSDRGRGNNRCGGITPQTNPPGGNGENPPGRNGENPPGPDGGPGGDGPSVQVAPEVTEGQDVAGVQDEVADEGPAGRGDEAGDQGSPAGDEAGPGPGRFARLTGGQLPFTGIPLLAVFGMALVLGAAGAALRRATP